MNYVRCQAVNANGGQCQSKADNVCETLIDTKTVIGTGRTAVLVPLCWFHGWSRSMSRAEKLANKRLAKGQH